jgi:hypothetical protein
MSDNASVLSRFLVKFAEIIAAGLATAVSGYLIAHLSGVLSSPVPAPASSPVPAPARAVIEAVPNASPPAQPPSSISGDLSEQHTPAKEAAFPAPQVTRPATPAKIVLPRKHAETATSAAESKRDQESLVARVRDALANVDASRTGLPALPARGDARLNPAGPVSQPQSSTDSSRSTVTGPARPSTGELRSVPTQPAQPNPLIAVEIQSRPGAVVQPSPTAPAETETGIVSTLEQMLRHDPLAGSEEAPRPPMPVGQ